MSDVVGAAVAGVEHPAQKPTAIERQGAEVHGTAGSQPQRVLFGPQVRPLGSSGTLWFPLPFTLFLEALSAGSSFDGWLWSVEESAVRPVVLDMPVLRTAKVVFSSPTLTPSFSAAASSETAARPGLPGLLSSFEFRARPHRARHFAASDRH